MLWQRVKPADAARGHLGADEILLPSENDWAPRQKKQHARVKNMRFRLETRIFSSSIRSARGEAVLHW
jgi:hypothetical protein